MKKINITTHSKVRYSERVGYRDNLEQELSQAKKYGIKKKDFPLDDKKNREFMCNKIYFDRKIFVFANSTYKDLLTVYPYTKQSFYKMFIEKKNRIIKLINSKTKKQVLKQTHTSLSNQLYSIVLTGNKIVEFKPVKSVKYRYGRYGLNKNLCPTFESIAKVLKGESVKPIGKIDLDYFRLEERNVYKEILKLSYGKTITYTELLVKVNKNYNMHLSIQKLIGIVKSCPIMFLIPTHRVVSSKGYVSSAGLAKTVKEKLMSIEKDYKEVKTNNRSLISQLAERFSCSIGALVL